MLLTQPLCTNGWANLKNVEEYILSTDSFDERDCSISTLSGLIKSCCDVTEQYKNKTGTSNTYVQFKER